MKYPTFFLFFLFALTLNANMASPLDAGTKSSTVLTSKDVDILSENIGIVIDKDFKTARFYIEYTIRVDSAGQQIPLLFYADNYKGDFSVWVDGQKVPVQKIPKKYIHVADSPFASFSPFFQQDTLYNKQPDEVLVSWENDSWFVYRLNDLKYFEMPLAKGLHKIKVSYTADVWTYRNNWVKEYSFRYSLTPAKFWKSFGKLTVQVEFEDETKKYISNLGQPAEESPRTRTWFFDKLPAEYIQISYTPEVNLPAKILIAIDPLGISLVFALVLMYLHIRILYHVETTKKKRKYFIWTWILGSILFTTLILLIYVWAFVWIKKVIGPEAGWHGSYAFVFFLIFPVFLFIYFVLIRLFYNKYYKFKVLSQ